MDNFSIRWVGTVHTGDDFELILQTLEAGRDEGPLILAPRASFRTPSSDTNRNYRSLVFENPDWLGAHLAEHRNDLNHEIWLGICQEVPREKRDLATAALWHFAVLLDDLAKRNKRRPRPARAAAIEENLKPLDYGTVGTAPISSFKAVLSHSGEAFDDVAAAHGALPPTILILQS
jgi:hypothetical protein